MLRKWKIADWWRRLREHRCRRAHVPLLNSTYHQAESMVKVHPFVSVSRDCSYTFHSFFTICCTHDKTKRKRKSCHYKLSLRFTKIKEVIESENEVQEASMKDSFTPSWRKPTNRQNAALHCGYRGYSPPPPSDSESSMTSVVVKRNKTKV